MIVTILLWRFSKRFNFFQILKITFSHLHFFPKVFYLDSDSKTIHTIWLFFNDNLGKKNKLLGNLFHNHVSIISFISNFCTQTRKNIRNKGRFITHERNQQKTVKQLSYLSIDKIEKTNYFVRNSWKVLLTYSILF